MSLFFQKKKNILWLWTIDHYANLSLNLHFSIELEDFHRELKAEYQNLAAVANVLQIITSESPLIIGDCRQKPISFYLEKACQVLHTSTLYQKSLRITLNQIDVRNDDSLKKFDTMTTMPLDLSANLDRYLLFSTFLLTHK